MKPVSEYKFIGKSMPNSIIVSKVTAKEVWATDVRLPGMLHGRVVHPKTLGSTLISAGQLDKKQFPNSQVVVKGNLVGVVAPTEWKPSRLHSNSLPPRSGQTGRVSPAAQNSTNYLRKESDWTSAPVQKSHESKGDVSPALASAHKKLSATYQFSYMKHAPIGPTMALADVQSDGTVHIHTHNQNPQALRGEIATMLGTTPDHVIVHTHPGAGHYGPIKRRKCRRGRRSRDSLASRRQTRSRPVDAAPRICNGPLNPPQRLPTSKSPSMKTKKISAYQVDHYMPAMQDDRPIGAVLPIAPPCRRRKSSPVRNFHGKTDSPTLVCNQQIPMSPSLATALSRWGKKLRPSLSASAITACVLPASSSKTIPANSPSAKPRPSPAWTLCSSVSITPKKNAPSPS